MALISLSRVVEYLPNFDTDDNTILQSILNASSDLVEKYLGRNIASATYDQLYDGHGYRELFLLNYPIISVARVATHPTTVLNISNTNTANSRATVQVTSSGITLTRTASAVTTTNTVAFSFDTTVGAVASAINGFGGGWTATAMAPYESWASADLRAIQGALNAANSRMCPLVIHAEELSDYAINADLGSLVAPGGFRKGRLNWRVIATCGFSTTPEPISQVIAELSALVYKSRNVNGRLQSESLGSYSYTLANNATAEDPFAALSPAAKVALNLYRSHRIPAWEV